MNVLNSDPSPGGDAPCVRRIELRQRTFRFVLFAGVLATLASGCSLGVMAGKMFFGDPKVACDFTRFTQVDLTETRQRLLVLCSAPHSILDEVPSIELDLLDGITRRLKRQGINVINPDDVANWLDDHGPWEDLSELAARFDAHYVAHINLQRLSYHEDGSPNLFRGQAAGTINGYEVRNSDGDVHVIETFVQEFNSIYPNSYPVSADQKSETLFQKEYLDRLCTKLAQKFYDHSFSEEIE